MPEQEENEDAKSGTRIHNVLGNLEPLDILTGPEIETHDMCTEHAGMVISNWAEETPDNFMREKRLGMTALGKVVEVTADSKASFVFTGQADLILVQGSGALVIDFKTGRGDYADAVDNSQLAALAVLVAGWSGATEVRVAIVQPWAGKPTVADYNANALELARTWLLAALAEERQSTPDQAQAGEWCKWCKAKANCQAFILHTHEQLQVLRPDTIAQLDGEDQRAALFARSMELPPARLAAYVRGLPLIKRYIDAIMGAAKERAENDMEFQRFFRIETAQGNREITDAQLAFNALAPLGVTTEDALAACKMSLGPIEEAVRKASGIKSESEKRTTYNLTARQAKDAVNNALERAGAIKRGAEKRELVPVALEGGAE